MRFISQPDNWALLIELNYYEDSPTGWGRLKHPGRDSRLIGRQDNTELIVEIDHGDKEEYHVDGSVGVLRWEHERRRKYMRDAKLRAFIETFCPRVPKDKTYDKWYAESGPFQRCLAPHKQETHFPITGRDRRQNDRLGFLLPF